MYSERDLELLERAEEIFRANIYSSDENFPWSPYGCISPGKTEFCGSGQNQGNHFGYVV